MNDEHSGICAEFIDHILEKDGALLGCRLSSQRLLNRRDVVVDGFREAYHCQIVAVVGEVLGEGCGHGVGVVTAHGVENRDAIALKLFGGDAEGGGTFFDEAAFETVVGVGELDPAVANGAAAMQMEGGSLVSGVAVDRDMFALQ